MTTRKAPSAAPALTEKDTVLHSWCIQKHWNAPTIVGGEGARLFTADGRTILDMSSLAECSNLGHQHPKVIAAIRRQAQQLCFVTNGWGAEPRARLADNGLRIRLRIRVEATDAEIDRAVVVKYPDLGFLARFLALIRVLLREIGEGDRLCPDRIGEISVDLWRARSTRGDGYLLG